ncbi:hypothetical protein FNH22_20395 [Fulvivirga sp. M361]|uniref:lipopolysaccharide core heptose(II) kinase RfaY n=1 Tax=Fulvivirga sp. M361 TaxID=2594266 RepID=UPI00117A7B15|nr:lipopolysaccharide core heptose(II) kinase RfaY [Fulvivirga sp. M361]TRX53717.1 hypothetical protein FNH22_20395 [Fulvivirga sp. M361]
MVFNDNHKKILAGPAVTEQVARDLVKRIEGKDFTVTEILKDTSRSTVYRIAVGKMDLIYKIPHEKNSRHWIRFLTLFRSGEAFKNIQGMVLLEKEGFQSIKPILACEYRKKGMVMDSWLLYEYLPGSSCLGHEETYPDVVKLLSDLHQSNLLHGDPQIRNFLVKGDQLYIIDASPKRSGSKFKKRYEFAYLRKSAPDIEKYFGDYINSFYYRIAIKYDLYNQRITSIKKTLKAIISGNKSKN